MPFENGEREEARGRENDKRKARRWRGAGESDRRGDAILPELAAAVGASRSSEELGVVLAQEGQTRD